MFSRTLNKKTTVAPEATRGGMKHRTQHVRRERRKYESGQALPLRLLLPSKAPRGSEETDRITEQEKKMA